MANYKNFLDSAGSIRIEVDAAGGGSAAYSGALVGAVRDLAGLIGGQVSQMQGDQKPAEVLVEFGLRALAAGGYAICVDRAQANFRVSLKWGDSGGGGGLLGGLGVPPIPGA